MIKIRFTLFLLVILISPFFAQSPYKNVMISNENSPNELTILMNQNNPNDIVVAEILIIIISVLTAD